MPYYIDSSVNVANPDGTSSISRWEFIVDAQDEAVRLAKKTPGVEFYVNETIVTNVVVYKAMAVLDLQTEVINGIAD